MKIINIIICILLISTATVVKAAKNEYKIKVQLQNTKDTSLLLCCYYGTTNSIIDTAFVEGTNTFTFTGKKPLKDGVYLVVFQNKQYFELIIDKNQVFSVQTDPNDPINKMVVKNSPENTDFYNYQKQLNIFGKKEKKLDDQLKKEPNNKDSINKEKTEIKSQIQELSDSYIKEHPQTLFAKILLCNKEPEIPKVLPLKEDGTPDSSYIYKYYKEHYFDNFDFTDERLLRSPVYGNKIKLYYKKIIVQNPDTLIKESINIIEKAKPNKETYKYCIWYFTYEAETSNIMGMGRVFVTLGQKYYLTGEAYWLSDKSLARITERINTLARVTIGTTAPNIIMQDTTMNLISLENTEAKYTLVLFWDPDCGHCKNEIKYLIQWYNENAEKYGVKVFAVCSDTNVVKWENKIRDYKIHSWINVDGPRTITEDYHSLYDIISTPTIYLLDENKKIIAKKLSASQTTDFIKRDAKYKADDEAKKTN